MQDTKWTEISHLESGCLSYEVIFPGFGLRIMKTCSDKSGTAATVKVALSVELLIGAETNATSIKGTGSNFLRLFNTKTTVLVNVHM